MGQLLELWRHIDVILASQFGHQPRLAHQQATALRHVDDGVALGIDEIARKALSGIGAAHAAAEAYGFQHGQVGYERIFTRSLHFPER